MAAPTRVVAAIEAVAARTNATTGTRIEPNQPVRDACFLCVMGRTLGTLHRRKRCEQFTGGQRVGELRSSNRRRQVNDSGALVTLRPSVWYPGAVATLDEMYVVPELRGQGIGSEVLGRAIAECAVRGVDSVEINVDESDVDAARFYRHHGFADTDPSTNEKAFYFFREL